MRIFFCFTGPQVTDLCVQLYKKRQQQHLPKSSSDKYEEEIEIEEEDKDSLENARITSSDDENEVRHEPLNRSTSNRIVQKSAKISPYLTQKPIALAGIFS